MGNFRIKLIAKQLKHWKKRIHIAFTHLKVFFDKCVMKTIRIWTMNILKHDNDNSTRSENDPQQKKQ